MRAIARSGLILALSGLACTLAAAQTAPATKPAAGPNAPPTSSKPAGDPGQVLGTVNGESITRGELINFLRSYQIPAGDQEQVYLDAMNTLVNTHLVTQYLVRQNISVSEQKVDEAIATLEMELKKDGMDLPTQLRQSGMTLDSVRKEYASRLRWIDYVNKKATDAELKSFAETHKALFNGTQVRASHIVLKTEPNASTSDKEKIRQKLLGIKRDIESNKISFAEAANKYSEDLTANKEGKGGELGYFGLNSGVIEEFAEPAFALKKGVISDPVETPYGYHLILVTDRKEGGAFDFEQNKPLVKQVYAAELQKNVLSTERKKAETGGKIEIKPMPKDLFPPPTTSTPAANTKPETKK